MGPRFLLTIQAGHRRIPLPILLLFPLALLLEILAFVPLVIISIRKQNPMLWQIARRFYLSRLFLTLMFYGRKFRVRVRDEGQSFGIG